LSEPVSEAGVSRRGILLVISGPSGVGKSSVVHALTKRVRFHFSVSWTTRERRPGERDGVDYVFVNRSRFLDNIESGGFLEWAEYSGHLYGTPRAAVLAHLDAGHHVLLDIENDGAGQVKDSYPEALLVFLLPPSLQELERRLRQRGDTSEADIELRLGVAAEQMAEAEWKFDYTVVNDRVDVVAGEIVSILEAAGGS
jgi:guanylate kinase